MRSCPFLPNEASIPALDQSRALRNIDVIDQLDFDRGFAGEIVMKGSDVRGVKIVLGLVLALMGVAGCGEDKADADAATGTATETNAAAKPAAKPAGNLL